MFSIWFIIWIKLKFPVFISISLLLRDSEGRKLCKKVKVDPSSKRGGAELLHYKWVTRNCSHLRASWEASPCSQLRKHVIHRLLVVLWALCLLCLAEMGRSTPSTTGPLPSRWVLSHNFNWADGLMALHIHISDAWTIFYISVDPSVSL